MLKLFKLGLSFTRVFMGSLCLCLLFKVGIHVFYMSLMVSYIYSFLIVLIIQIWYVFELIIIAFFYGIIFIHFYLC